MTMADKGEMPASHSRFIDYDLRGYFPRFPESQMDEGHQFMPRGLGAISLAVMFILALKASGFRLHGATIVRQVGRAIAPPMRCSLPPALSATSIGGGGTGTSAAFSTRRIGVRKPKTMSLRTAKVVVDDDEEEEEEEEEAPAPAVRAPPLPPRTSSRLPEDLQLTTPPVNSEIYKRGQKVSIRIKHFSMLGATVTVNGGPDEGLVSNEELGLFTSAAEGAPALGDELVGFIGRVQEDNKLDVLLRAVDKERGKEVREAVLAALRAAPSASLPLGDRSSAAEVDGVFRGCSKSDFKKAIGALYKEGLVTPSGELTVLNPVPLPVPRASASTSGVQGERATIFIGNLPSALSEDELRAAVLRTLGPAAVHEVRMAADRDGSGCAGFGFVEIADEGGVDAEQALRALGGMRVKGRGVRVEHTKSRRNGRPALPEGRYTVRTATSEEVPVVRVRGTSSSSKVELRGAGKAERGGAAEGEGEEDRERWLEQRRVAMGSTSAFRLRPQTQTQTQSTSSVAEPKEKEEVQQVHEEVRTLRWDSGGSSRPRGYSVGSTSKGVQQQERRVPGRLYVGNLATKTDEATLRKHFEAAVEVPSSVGNVRIMTEKETGRSRGFGFVDILDRGVFEEVRAKLNGGELQGRRLRLDEDSAPEEVGGSRPRARSADGGGMGMRTSDRNRDSEDGDRNRDSGGGYMDRGRERESRGYEHRGGGDRGGQRGGGSYGDRGRDRDNRGYGGGDRDRDRGYQGRDSRPRSSSYGGGGYAGGERRGSGGGGGYGGSRGGGGGRGGGGSSRGFNDRGGRGGGEDRPPRHF